MEFVVAEIAIGSVWGIVAAGYGNLHTGIASETGTGSYANGPPGEPLGHLRSQGISRPKRLSAQRV